MNETEDSGLDEELQKLPLKERILYRGLIKRLKGGGRQSIKFVQVLEDMGRLAGWSQDARNAYWDVKRNQPKENPEYEKAKVLINRGISICDKILIDFPTTYSSVLPMKRTLIIQYTDINYLEKGIIKTQMELEKEVDTQVKL